MPGAALAERHTIPLFPPAGASDAPQGVLRILNGGNESGTVTIRAIDDAGTRSGPATFTLEAWAAAEFDAADLASGSPAKGLSGAVGPLVGDVRLEIETGLDIVPLAYARAADGTLSAIHDTVPASEGGGSTGAAGTYRYEVPVFNPASEVTQASRLRLVNPGEAVASVTIIGRDDSGAVAPGGSVRLTLPPGGARTLTATQLEAGDAGLEGSLGAGTGRWRLTVSSDRPLLAVNAAASRNGWHWNNLSTVRGTEPGLAGSAPASAWARRYTIPWFAPAGPSPAPQGLLRIVNNANEAGTVEIRAIDDVGARSASAAFTLNAGAAAEFDAPDLVAGNPAKGLSGGAGPLAGDVRLEIETDLDIAALAFARATDGALSAMHDTVSAAAGGDAGQYRYDVPMFNPASEAAQASRLRLVNLGDAPASVMIEGRDDFGGSGPGGAVRLTLPAGAARTLTALELEAGGTGLMDRLGAGTGRWRLTVSSDQPLQAVNAMAASAGYLTNHSTVAVTEANVVTPAESFDLERAPNDALPFGIAHAYGRLYVVHWGVNKVYAYRYDGGRDPSSDFDLLHAPFDISYANNLFYIVSHVSGVDVYAYRADGTHVTADGFKLHEDNAFPAGITYDNGRFYIVDYDFRDDKIYAYLSNGQRDPLYDIDLYGYNTDPYGITYADGRFYVGDNDDARVYAYRADGTHDAAAGFDLHGDNADITGIAYADGWFFVLDHDDRKIYKYRVDGQPGGGSGGDHGDDAASASRISTNSTTAGSLERGGDKDFFRIEVPRTGDLLVETTGNTDTYGVLTSADGSLRRTNDDGGERSNFRISLNDAAPGVYHIEVRGYSGNTTGDYSLSVSFTPTVDTRPSFAAGSGPGDQNYTVGAPIAALTLPVPSGGDGALTYTLTPDVPGLSFDTATRRLSGTPSAAGTYAMTFTATDIDGDSATLRFSIAVQAAGGGGGVAADGSFALHGDNRWPSGITHAAGRFHVVDYWDGKVYAYRADGGRDGSADFDLHGDNGWPTGIVHAGDRFHVVDWWDKKVYAYRADGRRDGSADFDLHGDNGWPTGIVHAGDRFHVVDWWDKKVYAYRADGRRDGSADFDLHGDNYWPTGIAHAGDRFHVVDEGHDKVYAYRADGRRDQAVEFDLSAENDDPAGIVHIDGRFHVVDAGDEKVYAYPPGGDATHYGTGDNIPGLPTGFWAPDAISGGEATIAGGGTSIRLDDGGYFEKGENRYTCRNALGCEVVGGQVRSGMIVRSEVGTAPGFSGGSSPMLTFDLDPANGNPADVTYAQGRFHVVDRRGMKVYAYRANGQRDETADFHLHENNHQPMAIIHINGRFHVVDWDMKVYAYRTDGQRDESADFDLHPSNNGPVGIAYADGRFHVVDHWDKKVYAYRTDGQRDATADFDLHQDIIEPSGIVYAEGRFHIVDIRRKEVYAYRVDGQRDAAVDFRLQVAQGSPTGIAYSDGRFYVVDSANDAKREKIFAYGEERMAYGVWHGIDEFPGSRLTSIYTDNVLVMEVDDLTAPVSLAAYANDFYRWFEDEFDYLLFLSNLTEDESPVASFSYAGKYWSVMNDTEGLGYRRKHFDNGYGSTGRLRGVVHLPRYSYLQSGPALHELQHAWSNWAVPTTVGGHWGFSSANGQLGGFDIDNLVDLGNGQWTAGRFGSFANYGNSVPYSPIELYFAGLAAPGEVPDLWVAEDGAWLLDDSGDCVRTADGYCIFTAEDVRTYSIADIVAEHGARNPPVAERPHQRAAVILLTDDDHPPTTDRLWEVSKTAYWLGFQGYDGNRLYNYYEATGGRASLALDGLSKLRKSTATAPANLPASFGVPPTPVTVPSSDHTHDSTAILEMVPF